MPLSEVPAARVSSFEGRLLSILDGLLGRTSSADLARRLAEPAAGPRTLRRSTVRLIERRLQRGLVWPLARGGWPRTACFTQGRSIRGRLWERHPVESMALRFSSFTVELLFWLGSGAATQPRSAAILPETIRSGDRVLAVHAWGVLRETPLAAACKNVVPWSNDGLLRLLWPKDFAGPAAACDFTPWFAPASQWLLEAWQRGLESQASERLLARLRSNDAGVLHADGEVERRTFDAFLRHADAAGRRDLALWILAAAGRALHRVPNPDPSHASLESAATSSASGPDQPAEGVRPAWCLLDALDVLRAWNADAGRTGFLDEDYAASQHWKAAWERSNGDDVLRRSREYRSRVRDSSHAASLMKPD